MTTEPTAAEVEAAARALRAADGALDVAAVMHTYDGDAHAALAAALPLVEARLREQIEHGAAIAAERHTADMVRGGCSCGFCVWSVEHVVRVAIREAV